MEQEWSLMASTDFDPWQFLAEGRFTEAVAYFEKRQPSWLDKDWREPSTMATAYLCLREYEKAAVMLSLGNAMAAIAEKRKEGPLLDHEGGALWLTGKKEEGAALWQKAVQGIMDGTITHADFSGGALVRGGIPKTKGSHCRYGTVFEKSFQTRKSQVNAGTSGSICLARKANR
jgi:hypothetical protein